MTDEPKEPEKEKPPTKEEVTSGETTRIYHPLMAPGGGGDWLSIDRRRRYR